MPLPRLPGPAPAPPLEGEDVAFGPRPLDDDQLEARPLVALTLEGDRYADHTPAPEGALTMFELIALAAVIGIVGLAVEIGGVPLAAVVAVLICIALHRSTTRLRRQNDEVGR